MTDTPPPIQTAQPSPRHRFPLLGTVAWVALAGSLGGVGALALGACGLSWPGNGQPIVLFCPEPAQAAPAPSTALLAEQSRARTLQQELDRLTLALLDAPDCVVQDEPELLAEVPIDEPPVPVDLIELAELPAVIDDIDIIEDLIEDPVDLPIEEADLALDEPPIPDPPAVPEPPVEPAPNIPDMPDVADAPDADDVDIAAADADREMPTEDWNERDVSFLEGCWSLATDYSITRTDTGEVFNTQAWEMCFDRSGFGTQELSFDNGGLTCSGGVRAQFGQDGTLTVIDRGNVPCSNGSAIDQRIIACERMADGTVNCNTRHTTPPAHPMPVSFRR